MTKECQASRFSRGNYGGEQRIVAHMAGLSGSPLTLYDGAIYVFALHHQ
jgi:hypothetical protein